MYKHYNHEGGNCSPFIAHWPEGIDQPDRWVRDPMHLFDIMPTLCEIANADYPETYRGERIHPQEGMSLVPIFNAQNLPERSLCFDHFEASAIRKGEWKLLKGNTRYPSRDWELYDIKKDRCETNDQAKEHPQLVDALEQEWREWAVRVKVHPYGKDA
jgi:arylsulfatase